jgi:hypothetical protein
MKADQKAVAFSRLGGSRPKSGRFLVGKSNVDVTSYVDGQIIEINHQLNLSSSSSLKIVIYLTDLISYIMSQKHVHRSCIKKILRIEFVIN